MCVLDGFRNTNAKYIYTYDCNENEKDREIYFNDNFNLLLKLSSGTNQTLMIKI
jgi:hypothetical protein